MAKRRSTARVPDKKKYGQFLSEYQVEEFCRTISRLRNGEPLVKTTPPLGALPSDVKRKAKSSPKHVR